PLEQDLGAGRSVDHDAVRPGHQNARFDVVSDDADRFGDSHGSESAGIQNIDLAAGGGFRDRACECLAWSGPAARIGVVAYARYPGSRRLRLSERATRQTYNKHRKHIDY